MDQNEFNFIVATGRHIQSDNFAMARWLPKWAKRLPLRIYAWIGFIAFLVAVHFILSKI